MLYKGFKLVKSNNIRQNLLTSQSGGFVVSKVFITFATNSYIMEAKVQNLVELAKNSNQPTIEIFENSEFGKVRTVIKDDGTYLFCGVDVAKILGYKNTRDAVAKHCKSPSVVKCDSSIGTKIDINFIPESDVYRLVMRSKLPTAERFQDWVCEDVLPTLRKHGAYTIGLKGTPSCMIDNTRERVMRWLEERESFEAAIDDNIRLEKENRKLRPKGTVFDIFLNTESMSGIREFSIQLGISERELVNFLIGKGFLYRETRNKQKPLKISKSKSYMWFTYKDMDENGNFVRNKIMITPLGKGNIAQMLINEGIINKEDIHI